MRSNAFLVSSIRHVPCSPDENEYLGVYSTLLDANQAAFRWASYLLQDYEREADIKHKDSTTHNYSCSAMYPQGEGAGFAIEVHTLPFNLVANSSAERHAMDADLEDDDESSTGSASRLEEALDMEEGRPDLPVPPPRSIRSSLAADAAMDRMGASSKEATTQSMATVHNSRSSVPSKTLGPKMAAKEVGPKPVKRDGDVLGGSEPRKAKK